MAKLGQRYLALKCLECGTISVLPERTADGSTCLECNGYTTPIGPARIKNGSTYNATATISIDTTELDKTLEKFREIERIHDKTIGACYGK